MTSLPRRTGRTRLSVLAVVLAGVALTSCTFTTTSETTEVSGAQGSATAQPQNAPGASTGRGPTGSTESARPHVSALCDDLADVYLSDLSTARNPRSIVEKWTKLSASAPASLKPDVETVAAYLSSAASRDYATLKKSSDRVQSALDRIDSYVTRVCHA